MKENQDNQRHESLTELLVICSNTAMEKFSCWGWEETRLFMSTLPAGIGPGLLGDGSPLKSAFLLSCAQARD